MTKNKRNVRKIAIFNETHNYRTTCRRNTFDGFRFDELSLRESENLNCECIPLRVVVDVVCVSVVA